MKKRYLIPILICFILLSAPIKIKADISESKVIEIYTAEEFQAALDNDDYDGYTFKLMADMKGNFICEKQQENGKKSITIDLNNHSITGSPNETEVSVLYFPYISVVLTDNSPSKTRHYYKLVNNLGVLTSEKDDEHFFDGGYITGANTEIIEAAKIMYCQELLMENGTIFGNETSEGNISAKNIELTGGNIIGNRILMFGGNISGTNVIIGGSSRIVDNYAGHNAGVSGKNITINGGIISRNTSHIDSAGIYCTGTLTVNGGVISNNNGCGITFSGDSFIMNGGIVSNNTANGIGITTEKSSFILNGGTIENNGKVGVNLNAYSTITMNMTGGIITKNKGGGIYTSRGTLKMSGGEITNNETAGVILGSVLKVSGSPKIYNNYTIERQQRINCNVRMYSDTYIEIDGTLNKDAKIGVCLYHQHEKGTTTIITRGLINKADKEYFNCDTDDYELVEKNAQLALYKKHDHEMADSSKIESDTSAVSTQILIPKLTKAKNSKKKTVTLKWQKIDNVDGYQIQYALNKKFTKSLKVKKAKPTATSIKLKKLKKKKTYYIRIRGYKGSEYGQWSNIKKVKIKK